MSLFGSRRGASNLGLPLMLAAFVAMGGFLYWLYVTAEPTQPAVVGIEEDSAEAATQTGMMVEPDSLKTSPERYEGQQIRVENVEVTQNMGRTTMFVDLPESANLPPQSFLVRIGPAIDSAAAAPQSGSRVTVVGTLAAMSDSIVTDWIDSGSITETDRLLVEFATHFMIADEIQTRSSGSGSQSAPAPADSAAGGA